MLVNEIFSSIEGEGIRTGYPVTFVRLFGCNLDCPYCDTTYACKGSDFFKMSVMEIVAEVADHGNRRVTLTGGEPLIHRDVFQLVHELTKSGFEVNIETNGAVYIGEYTDIRDTIITMDYKTPSSGMTDKMDMSNMSILRKQDVLKFVVGNLEDLEDMKRVLEHYKPDCSVFVSPIFGQITPVEIVNYIKENNLQECRVQVQLHKIIWAPETRGV
jgi:7-carboxy-7-deazaguanine synthase